MSVGQVLLRLALHMQGFRLGCRLKGMVAFVVFVVIVSVGLAQAQTKKRAGPRRVGVAIELM